MAKSSSSKVTLNSKKTHGKHSKSSSNSPFSKVYEKKYRGQGR